jgi:hypothetical protein
LGKSDLLEEENETLIAMVVTPSLSVTRPNNNTRFGGVTMLQDNKKTKAIEI